MNPSYFTDGVSTWKFEPGKRPMFRYNDEPEWRKSAFRSLAQFQDKPGKTKEISAARGEKVEGVAA